MKSIVAAFQFLTILSRLIRSPTNPAMVGKASVLFPVVGLVLGLSLALLARTLAKLCGCRNSEHNVSGLSVLATGGLHLKVEKRSMRPD